MPHEIKASVGWCSECSARISRDGDATVVHPPDAVAVYEVINGTPVVTVHERSCRNVPPADMLAPARPAEEVLGRD